MLKKFFGLLALILLVNFSVANAAQIQPVTDKAGLLTSQEINALNEKIRQVEQKYQIKIGVAFVKSTGGRDMVQASNNFLDKNFSNNENGSIVLFVDMNRRKYEISTDPFMREKITDDSGIPYLKDKFQSSLSNGDYSGTVSDFVDGVEELMTFYQTNEGAYGDVAPKGFDPLPAAGAVVGALLAALTVRSWLIDSMSNIRHVVEASDYLKKDTVNITENRDTYLFTNIKRRPRSSSSSSGGGSHGGGGHGGGGGSF